MKKHMVKKAIAFSLASLMAVNCSMTIVGSGTPWITGLSAHAANETSGTCGAGLKWELDTAGVLTISAAVRCRTLNWVRHRGMISQPA